MLADRVRMSSSQPYQILPYEDWNVIFEESEVDSNFKFRTWGACEAMPGTNKFTVQRTGGIIIPTSKRTLIDFSDYMLLYCQMAMTSVGLNSFADVEVAVGTDENLSLGSDFATLMPNETISLGLTVYPLNCNEVGHLYIGAKNLQFPVVFNLDSVSLEWWFVPEAPKAIVGRVYPDGIQLTWDEISGAEQYQIYRKINSGRFEKIAISRTNIYLDESVKGFEDGTEFSYYIIAEAEGQESPPSNIVIVDWVDLTPEPIGTVIFDGINNISSFTPYGAGSFTFENEALHRNISKAFASPSPSDAGFQTNDSINWGEYVTAVVKIKIEVRNQDPTDTFTLRLGDGKKSGVVLMSNNEITSQDTYEELTIDIANLSGTAPLFINFQQAKGSSFSISIYIKSIILY